jgi:hypothetical protein
VTPTSSLIQINVEVGRLWCHIITEYEVILPDNSTHMYLEIFIMYKLFTQCKEMPITPFNMQMYNC